MVQTIDEKHSYPAAFMTSPAKDARGPPSVWTPQPRARFLNAGTCRLLCRTLLAVEFLRARRIDLSASVSEFSAEDGESSVGDSESEVGDGESAVGEAESAVDGESSENADSAGDVGAADTVPTLG